MAPVIDEEARAVNDALQNENDQLRGEVDAMADERDAALAALANERALKEQAFKERDAAVKRAEEAEAKLAVSMIPTPYYHFLTSFLFTTG